jgi:hypothetical protein
MKRTPGLTPADKIVIVVSVSLVVASYVFANATNATGTSIVVQIDGRTVYKASLGEPRTFDVQGALGPVTVEIRDGKAAITHSDCPNHICVRTGWRSKSGEIIVCVPNKTVVRIAGPGHAGVRATTG